MPQTKPLLWSKMLISISILFVAMTTKLYHLINMKKINKKSLNYKSTLMKW